ncbi:MAG: apolipoprotein N-acyltransferase [Myxococcota bacterium]
MSARVVVSGFLGGLLLAASFLIRGAWPLAFVAVAIFVLTLERCRTGLGALISSATFGIAGYLGGFYWLQPALVAFTDGRIPLSWAVWLGLGAWVSVRFVLIGIGFRALRGCGQSTVVSLVLPWVVIEWLYPSLFPFYLANALLDRVWLAQLAALGGPTLVSAWGCAASALAAEPVLRRWGTRGSSGRVVGATLGAMGVAILYGAWSVERVDERVATAPTITVGIVQANVGVTSGRADRALAHRRYLELSRRLESEGPVDLLVWPETAYDSPLPDRLPTSGALVRGDLEAALVFGSVVRNPQDRDTRFNSALLVGNDGMIRTQTHKRVLIPFAEYTPLRSVLENWSGPVETGGHFEIGPATDGLAYGDSKIAVPICYEAIRPGYVRALVFRTRPSLLVTLANDGWFGDSHGPGLHLRLARLRAIEHQRYLVRATNTGISAVVDPVGRVLEETPLNEVATLRSRVHVLQGPTPYGLVGDWPGYLSVVWLTWLLVAHSQRSTRR